MYNTQVHAPVAQLDRALDSDSKGRRFEFCRAYHVGVDCTPKGKNRSSDRFFPFYVPTTPPLGNGSRTRTACWRHISVLFTLLSSPCASKASSAAAKIPQNLSANRCEAVFAERFFAQARRSPQQILTYSQGIQRSMGGKPPAKTGTGSTSVALRKPVT